jgi:hypothetical protein
MNWQTFAFLLTISPYLEAKAEAVQLWHFALLPGFDHCQYVVYQKTPWLNQTAHSPHV